MEIIHLKDTQVHEALISKNGLAFDLYCNGINISTANMTPSLSALRQNDSDGSILKTLAEVVSRKLKALGERGNMTPEEIRAVAIDFFQLRQSMSIEDLILCLDMGRQGKFGKVFGKVDAITINEWLMKYADRKAELLEHNHNELKRTNLIESNLAKRLLNDLPKEQDNEKNEENQDT